MLRTTARQWRRQLPRFARFSTAAEAVQEAASNEKPAQEIEVLRLEAREEDGSRASRRMRERGLLPGVVYGPDEQGKRARVLVTLERRAFERLHRKLGRSMANQVFTVRVGDRGELTQVLMRDIQFDVGA